MKSTPGAVVDPATLQHGCRVLTVDADGKPVQALRQRKKERTRQSLTAAAVRLFIERGYDATTVDDIAAAVEVSPRTFFRYFPSKDDVVVDLLREGVVDLIDQLSSRPEGEPLAQALRGAARCWARLTDDRAQSLLQLSQVLTACPSLRAQVEERRRCGADHLARVVAQRLNVDLAQDPRPMLIVTLVSAVMANAVERWSASGGADDLATYMDEGFDLLEFGMPAAA